LGRLLERTIELRQRNHRTLSSFASDFIAREISEISVARFSPDVVALHELQIVDDDQPS
jgi:hypothetical protein